VFCPHCGSENSDTSRFCQNCGASLTPGAPPRKPGGRATTGLEPNLAGLLCYILGWVSGLIFIIIEKDDQFVRFHAMQSIITFGGLTLIGLALGWIPFVGTVFSGIVGAVAFVLWVVLMIKAFVGLRYKLPYIGELAERQLERM